MRRRFFGAVLCLLLLPVFGTARFLLSVLRVMAWRPRRFLVIGGLAVAVSATHSAPLLAPNGVGPLGHMIPFCVGVVGIVVFWRGFRSRELRLLWRWLSNEHRYSGNKRVRSTVRETDLQAAFRDRRP
jgi:hypothetical protein